MFQKITPEQAGVSSKDVARFIESLSSAGLVMHSLLIMKGDNIFTECYYKPFTQDKVHRMYSQTKSLVGIAIGLLIEDGLININDKIHTYFPEKIDNKLNDYLLNLTIKDMLTMQTCGEVPNWYYLDETDRTHLYFNQNSAAIPSGMRFYYDSTGSQVLSTLVEKITGKSLFDFLNERIFKHLGTFKNATILKTRNNDSHGDSALLCTPRDLASFARLLMNGGKWENKQLINEEYVKTATSKIVSNMQEGFDDVFSKGYGYQIWRVAHNGFAFNGMGCQFTLCYPEKDIIFVCTADNQGFMAAKALIINNFYNFVYDNIKNTPLPENKQEANKLEELCQNAELFYLKNDLISSYKNTLSGKKYICEENPSGITEFKFEFIGSTGKFIYKNAQGNKVLPFGINKNVFCKFPQLGYSDVRSGLPSENPDFMYDCASSACWAEEQKIFLKVQIIDNYLGSLFIVFSFKENYATVTFKKCAESFLDEYQGEFVARLAE